MNKFLKVLLTIFTSFVSLTAIVGGILILGGVDEFPIEWLERTPFKSYIMPAIILTVFVGGSSLLAAILLINGKSKAKYVTLTSGLILVIYILVEITILKQVPPGPTPIELFYLTVGIFITGIAFYLYKLKNMNLK